AAVLDTAVPDADPPDADLPDAAPLEDPLGCAMTCALGPAAALEACLNGDPAPCVAGLLDAVRGCLLGCAPDLAAAPEGPARLADCGDACFDPLLALTLGCLQAAPTADCARDLAAHAPACVWTCLDDTPVDDCFADCGAQAAADLEQCLRDGGGPDCQPAFEQALATCTLTCPPIGDCANDCAATAQRDFTACLDAGMPPAECGDRLDRALRLCGQVCAPAVP
ncbi:MAG: hypothetical protein KC620_21240, partial [Myxococcales bacterium]|nr:hypothetical protein [Myxococcales bacterium]